MFHYDDSTGAAGIFLEQLGLRVCSLRVVLDSCSLRVVVDSCSLRVVLDSCSLRVVLDSCSLREVVDSVLVLGYSRDHSESGGRQYFVLEQGRVVEDRQYSVLE